MRRLPLSLLLLGVACSEYGFSPDKGVTTGDPPAIDVSPSLLAFLPTAAGDGEVRAFQVTNVGGSPLQVTEITVVPVEGEATSFTLLTGADDRPEWLEPADWFEVEVAYTPQVAGLEERTVLVSSSDPEAPQVEVQLTGEGLVPELLITPAELDLGSLPLGCTVDGELSLYNAGEAPLTVSELSFEADAGLSVVEAPPVPFELAVGEVDLLRVRFEPTTEGSASSLLTVRSNDPAGIDTASQQGIGEPPATVTETFEVGDDPALDLLLAVDQSCSMEDDQVALAANFSTFITDLSTVTSNWRLGVVTTDDACFNEGTFSASTPSLVSRFTTAVETGEDREIVDDEALLKMSTAALDNAADGTCNSDFLRPGAAVHVVVVSDEPERSSEQAAAYGWELWVDKLSAHAASGPGLRISGVVDQSRCNEGDAGYAEAIAATSGEHLDICAEDWAGALEDIAEASVGLVWSYTLDGEPLDGSVTVAVDGTELEPGAWSYQASSRTVSFSERPDGTEVTVTYAVATDCP